METDIFQKPTGTWYGAAQEQVEGSSHRLLWGILGGIAGAGLAFALGFLGGHASVPGLEQQKAALVQQLQQTKQQEQVLLISRRCSTYDQQIAEIQSLIHAGKPEVAGALATVDLHDAAHPVCPQTRVELAALAYNATMTGLFQSAQPDTLDPTPLLTWRSADRQADLWGVPASERLSPLSIASQAYNDHLWDISREAFLQAWRAGLVGSADLSEVSFYLAILRNQGDLLLRSGMASNQHQGAVLLRTGDAISQAYNLGRGECHTDLVRFLGSNESQWPGPDPSDPVLAAAKGH